MSITFSGTTDNSNFNALTNQSTEYKVLDKGTNIVAKANQKAVIKDETIILNSGMSNSPNHPQIIAEAAGSEITFDGCNIQTGIANPAQKQIRGNINLINSRLLVKPSNGRVNTLSVNKVEGLALKVERKTPREQMFLYVNQNAIIRGLPGKPNIFGV